MAGTARLTAEKPPTTSNPKIVVNRPVVPAGTVDLHGMTIAEAHSKVLATLDLWRGKAKSITFITGQSGGIRSEFVHWLSDHAAIRRIEPMNGGGAFKVFLKKV
ncbi:unnamed protein product [Sphagnum tenellum]